MRLVWLAFGGAFGTLCRYGIASLMQQWLGLGFPYGTLAVNLLGCFCIGFLAELFNQVSVHPDARLALMTGVLGGFTTFSAFGLDTFGLVRNESIGMACTYVLLTLGLGLAAVWGGVGLARLGPG